MTQKNDKVQRIVWLFILILFIISIFNIHIETYETTKTINKELDYFGYGGQENWVKIPNRGLENIYCDVPVKPCVFGEVGDTPICYEWVSNVVGDWRSKYIRINNYGGKNCVIEKIVTRWRFSVK